MAEKKLKDILDSVTADGSSGYKAEKNRYHLYVGHGCPYASRVAMVRTLKGLEAVITMDVLDPVRKNSEKGWNFSPDKENCTADTVCGKEFLREIFQMSHPTYTGRITVPVLFDKQTKKIVSTDSAAMMRMLNSEFNEFCATEEQAKLDLYPEKKRNEIDELKKWILPSIVHGVYGIPRAKTQQEYNERVEEFFASIDKVDAILSKRRFLAGSEITEVDVMLFTPLVRFDAAFYSLFKCNKKMLKEYSNVWPYVRDIYQTGNISSTVDFQHIKAIYYSNKEVNPSLIIPIGPIIDFNEKTDRSKLVEVGS